MRPHVAHDQITVLLYRRAPRRNLTPRIVNLLEKVPQRNKAGSLGENECGMGKSRRMDFALAERDKSLGVAAGLQQRKILVRVHAFLFGKMAHEKIGKRTKGRYADDFSFEIFVFLD